MATTDSFEREFARFLDRAPDVVRFAGPGTDGCRTPATASQPDSPGPSHAATPCYPEWIVAQEDRAGRAYWLVKTKPGSPEGAEQRDRAVEALCDRLGTATGETWLHLCFHESELDFDYATFQRLVVHVILDQHDRQWKANPTPKATIAEILEWIREGREERTRRICPSLFETGND